MYIYTHKHIHTYAHTHALRIPTYRTPFYTPSPQLHSPCPHPHTLLTYTPLVHSYTPLVHTHTHCSPTLPLSTATLPLSTPTHTAHLHSVPTCCQAKCMRLSGRQEGAAGGASQGRRGMKGADAQQFARAAARGRQVDRDFSRCAPLLVFGGIWSRCSASSASAQKRPT